MFKVSAANKACPSHVEILMMWLVASDVLSEVLRGKTAWNTMSCYNLLNFSPKNDAIMGVMASQITSLTIVYSTVYLGADQRKHQSSASLAFVRGIHRGPVNSPHKWPVTRKMFPFDDVIMNMTFHGAITEETDGLSAVLEHSLFDGCNTH